MKTTNNIPKLIVSIALSAAILVAIIVCSFAWFSSSNVSVRATEATFTSQGTSTLIIDTTADESYGRYMGQTGIQYNGDDSPYYFVYTPFHVDAEVLAGDTIGPYFTYKLTDSSKITLIIAGEDPIPVEEEDGWANFSMELHRVDYDEETDSYIENGVVYRSENGFFRNLITGELLSFDVDTEQYFSLYIYFQGDVAINLLATTHDDIDKKYQFDYSDEMYMFSTFTLASVFNLETLPNLSFKSDGYNADDSYNPIYKSQSLQFTVPSTGFNLKNGEGIAADWPIAEFYSSNEIDYSYYFIDWASREYDEEGSKWEFYIYRQTSTSDDVYTLSLRPLRKPEDQLTAVVGESKALNLEYNNESDDETFYIRPSSTYYATTGKATYNYDTQTITIINPTVVDNAVVMCDSNVIEPPEKEGYFFVGWSADEEPTYTNGVLNDAFNHLDMVLTEDTTLYAIYKQLVYVNLDIPKTWGENYANIDNMKIIFNEEEILPTNTSQYGRLTLKAEKGTSALDTLSLYGATARANIGNADVRALSLKGWAYQNGDEWVMLNSNSDFILSDEITFRPIWNERKTYTLIIDLHSRWKPVTSSIGIQYSTSNKITINNCIVVDEYTIKFNGNTTGSYIGTENSEIITLSNIPEGIKYNQIGIDSPTCQSAEGGYVASMYDFKKWGLGNNNSTGKTLDKMISDSTTFSLNQVVNDTTIATMTNNTIYVFFDR